MNAQPCPPSPPCAGRPRWCWCSSAAKLLVERLDWEFIEGAPLSPPPPPFLVHRRNGEQALIVADLMRAAAIQQIAFPPAAYTLVETVVAG